MSSIQSSIGLISGINIEETVGLLMNLRARPRDALVERNEAIKIERTEINRLSATLLSLRATTSTINQGAFDARAVASSNEDIVTASVQDGVKAALGSFSFTPLQTASTHQLISDPILDTSDLGTGTLSLGFGPAIDQGVDLNQLNGGDGFDAGKIKITDRSGASAVIDLRVAKTVEDVVSEINNSTDADVSASVSGGRFVLTDLSGGTGNLRVQEVAGGTTAASLGLETINVAADSAQGDNDIYLLGNNTRLSTLNDGAGIHFSDNTDSPDDLIFTLADGTGDDPAVGVDLSGAFTVGDVIDAINNDADLTGKVTAAIAADGRSIEITDLTTGGATFAITDGALGSAATDLGLTTTAAGGVISGSRVLGALQDPLVASLNGGQGFTLGTISITDRSGTTDASVDLSSATTLSEIIDTINASSADVTARVNDSRNGILITDNTGGSGNLTISDVSGTSVVDLGLTVDAATDSINGGSLGRASVSRTTLLSSLNGGSGIDVGDFFIVDSAGVEAAVDLNPSGVDAETLGDVIDAINGAGGGAQIEARINDTGDGIVVIDKAGGAGTLEVRERTGGTTAADLNILGSSSTTNEGGEQIIDGATGVSIDLASLTVGNTTTTLATLNDGDGISTGTFYVKPSSVDPETDDDRTGGFYVTIDDEVTVQDVLDEINTNAAAAGVSVTAQINEAGSGIEIVDDSGGLFQLSITDIGSGRAAEDLLIAGTAPDTADSQQSINGGGLLASEDSLGALGLLVNRINELELGVTASTFNDGSGQRLALSVDEPGAENRLALDFSQVGLSFTEVGRPRDAAIVFGGSGGASGVPIFSESNTFSDVIRGVDFTIQQASEQAVTIDVTKDTEAVTGAVQGFIDSYNSVIELVDQQTDFNTESFETGPLFGKSEVVQVDSQLGRLVSGTFLTSGEYRTLSSIGVSIGSSGQLSLNTSELTDALEADPDAVERLFLDSQQGVVADFNDLIDRLAGDSSSTLGRSSDTLQRKIDSNDDRIEELGERLAVVEERLFNEFFELEEVIGRLQSNLDLVNSIQPISIASNSSNS